MGTTISFLRFGKKPASGLSWNNETEQHEAGLSVFELVDGQPVWTADAHGFTARPAYVGTGIVVGFGGSGEPLVKVVAIKKATKKQQAALLSA